MDERRWNVYACPGDCPDRSGLWNVAPKDGVCPSCGGLVVPVVVVPASSVVPITRLRELLRDVSRDFAGAHVNAGEVVGAVHRLLDDVECASNPNNERTNDA